MNVLRIGIPLILLLAAMVSAIAVVWVRQQNRTLFAQLTQLQAERDALDVEYGRLELEQATWAGPIRIEAEAHDKLGMIDPDPSVIELVRP